MKPHLEEARRFLRMADADLAVFELIRNAPGIAPSMIGFHDQQAVEKSLKAVLFAYSVGFGRTHDLGQLGRLIEGANIPLPLDSGRLAEPTPSAVALRYDDSPALTMNSAEVHSVVTAIREWAEVQVQATLSNES